VITNRRSSRLEQLMKCEPLVTHSPHPGTQRPILMGTESDTYGLSVSLTLITPLVKP
jgi:hypothetical protein